MKLLNPAFSFKRKISFRNITVILLCLGLYLYIVLRAYLLSFTHDECLSFNILLGQTIWMNTANYHVLNTFLMGISYHLFGDSEFALRLPNVLAFGLYLTGCLLILRKAKNTAVLILGISALLLNPYLLDFFSLARGYGLSFGFVAMSAYFLLTSKSKQIHYGNFIKNMTLSTSFAAIASVADAAAINYYIIVVLIFTSQHIYLTFKFKAYSRAQHLFFIALLVIFLLPMSFVVNRLLSLKAIGQLFGNTGVWESLESLIWGTFSFSQYPGWFFPVFNSTMFFYLLLGVFMLIRKPSENLLKAMVLLLLFPLGFILEHYIFDANYPHGRSTLLLVPLFGIFLLFLAKEFYTIVRARWTPLVFALCILTAFPFILNLYSTLNLQYCQNWHHESSVKDAMEIVLQKSRNEKTRMSISNYWEFEPGINYYIMRWKMNVIPANRLGVTADTDFIYDNSDAPVPKEYVLLKHFEVNNSKLYMRRKD